jgi:hypothetical protein
MNSNMTNGHRKLVAIAVVIAAAAALLLFVNSIQTTLAQQKPTDSLTMTVNLQTHENEFLANQGYFQVNTLDMNASKGSKLCPSGDCQYSIENADFSPNTITGGYVFQGLLKVSTTAADGTINSKFYPMRAELDKTASQEKEGQTTEILDGSIKFGKNVFSPEFEYKVANGTLLVDPSAPVLSLHCVKG